LRNGSIVVFDVAALLKPAHSCGWLYMHYCQVTYTHNMLNGLSIR